MKPKNCIIGAAGMLAVGIVAGTSQAAPIPNAAPDLRAVVAQSSIVNKTASHPCWWRHGRRHCTWHGTPRASRYRNGRGDYYEHVADKLPYGTSRWWDQMARENRAGNPGGGGRR